MTRDTAGTYHATHRPVPGGTHRQTVARALSIMVLLLFGSICGGCQFFGVMAASSERFEEVDLPAEYRGLDGKTIAVLIDAPYEIQYEYPMVVPTLTDLINLRIISMLSDKTRVLATSETLNYQADNVYWTGEDYRDLAAELQVDRLVVIDLIEYRLLDSGNSYVWDGRCSGDVLVIEADGIDPSTPVYTKRVYSKYPKISGVSRDSEPRSAIERGLMLDFTQRVVWLFADHQRTKEEIRKESRIR